MNWIFFFIEINKINMMWKVNINLSIKFDRQKSKRGKDIRPSKIPYKIKFGGSPLFHSSSPLSTNHNLIFVSSLVASYHLHPLSIPHSKSPFSRFFFLKILHIHSRCAKLGFLFLLGTLIRAITDPLFLFAYLSYEFSVL